MEVTADIICLLLANKMELADKSEVYGPVAPTPLNLSLRLNYLSQSTRLIERAT